MLKIVTLITYFILISFPACAWSSAASDVVGQEKNVWLEKMKNHLPGLLCQPDQYFVKCFNTNQKTCRDFTQLLVEACLNNSALSLPPHLSESDEAYWGELVGRCSYDLYEKFMIDKKHTTTECQTPPEPKLAEPKHE